MKFLTAIAFLSAVAAQDAPSFLRRELGGCHDCSCFTCDDVEEKADGSLDVNIGHCKDGSISWMCCVGVDGGEGNCDVVAPCTSAKCTSISPTGGLTVNVPAGSSSVTINTHDGKTTGDADMFNSVCGGNGNQGGSCRNGGTAHCLIDFDIVNDCGYAPKEPETPVDPTPAPETNPPVDPTDAPVTPEPRVTAPPVDPTPAPETSGPKETAPPVDPTPAPETAAPTKGSGSGDPHFKTWTGDKFDYHGECDLVLVDNPSFDGGKGLKVHIRTTRIKYFSYIETIAVQIGGDVLEFANDAENFLINGEKVGENVKHHKTMLGGFVIRRDPRALSIRLHGDHRHNHDIAKIDLHTRKNGFPAVIVDGGNTDIFRNSLGLLGEWESGKKIARDGATEHEDATAFALEWQVRDHEPMLFSESRFPQYPSTCVAPEPLPAGRLGTALMEKEAAEACAHWEEDREDCMFDVIATRDVMVAQEGHIVHIE